MCRTRRAVRVLETSHPPTWYLPGTDGRPGSLEPAPGSSRCEWEGDAAFLTVVAGPARAERAAWAYRDAGPGRSWRCAARSPSTPRWWTAAPWPARSSAPQAGGFCGGWVTDDVVGPFTGVPGSAWW